VQNSNVICFYKSYRRMFIVGFKNVLLFMSSTCIYLYIVTCCLYMYMVKKGSVIGVKYDTI
jgi:hypothetical protein